MNLSGPGSAVSGEHLTPNPRVRLLPPKFGPVLRVPNAGSPIPGERLPGPPRPPAQPAPGVPGTRSPPAAPSSASPSPSTRSRGSGRSGPGSMVRVPRPRPSEPAARWRGRRAAAPPPPPPSGAVPSAQPAPRPAPGRPAQPGPLNSVISSKSTNSVRLRRGPRRDADLALCCGCWKSRKLRATIRHEQRISKITAAFLRTPEYNDNDITNNNNNVFNFYLGA